MSAIRSFPLLYPFLVVITIAVIPAKAASAFGSGGLEADNGAASAPSNGSNLAISINIKNTSERYIQIFISESPHATDNAGNSYSVDLIGDDVGGIYICKQMGNCLTSEKVKTEQNATLVKPEARMVITMTFCCRYNRDSKGTLVSVGLTIHARDIIDEGREYGPWKTLSLGLPNIPIR